MCERHYSGQCGTVVDFCFVCCFYYDDIFSICDISSIFYFFFIVNLFIFCAVVVSEEIPLTSTNSENQEISQPTSGYDSAVNETEKRLFSVSQDPSVDCNRLKTSPQQKSPFNNTNDETESLLDTQQERSNLRDLKAMSIASIYDQEHDEIDDADK